MYDLYIYMLSKSTLFEKGDYLSHNDKKPDLIDWFQKNISIIIIVFIVLVVIIPFVIWFIMHFCFGKLVTIDGVLGYIGSVVGGVSALVVAFIGIKKEKDIQENKEEKQIELRRQAIKPTINLTFKMEEDEEGNEIIIYTFSNHSDFHALNPYFETVNAGAYISKNHPLKISVSINNKSCLSDFYLTKSENDLFENKLPKTVSLVFTDMDNNVIMQDFECYFEDGKYLYLPKEIEYC